MDRTSGEISLGIPVERRRALIKAYRAATPSPTSRPPGSDSAGRSDARLSEAELGRVARALFRLQRGLTGERELAGAAYMDDPELLGAYLLYYWTSSYAQASRAMALSGLWPRRVLDLGSGPGPMAAAALDRCAASAVLIDGSERALALAGRLLGQAAALTERADLESLPPGRSGGEGFDLVMLGHALNELSGPDAIARRAAVVRAAAASLEPGGSVLMIEPATLSAAREAMALRDLLVAEGWVIVAPCSRSGPCPALQAGPGQSCHDEAAWEPPDFVLELAARCGLDRGLVKMSWFCLRPPEARLAVEGAIASGEAYRVVSEPMLNKAGRVRRLLCGPAGRFPLSAKRGDPAAEAAGFFALGRYELLRVVEPERREGGWGVGPATRLERLRPALAPRPEAGL